MNYQPFITTTFIVAAVSLPGLVTVQVQSAEHPHSAHQAADAPRTPTTNAPATNPFAKEARIDAETHSPPGVVGKNWPEPIEDSKRFGFLLVDQLEYRINSSAADTFRWDVVGWYGGDYNRLWVKTEGNWRTSGERGGEAEAQLLYGRLIAPFWDFQVGLRYDQFSGAGFDRSRGFAVIDRKSVV